MFSLSYMTYGLLVTTLSSFVFFFFNDTATTEIYTLSLHDALPISWKSRKGELFFASFTGLTTLFPDSAAETAYFPPVVLTTFQDRKSTRLNSSHGYISYAVFCLKKKKKDKSLSHVHARRDSETHTS